MYSVVEAEFWDEYLSLKASMLAKCDVPVWPKL